MSKGIACRNVSMILVAALLAANGCVSVRPDAPTVIDETKFRAAFGDVPIIQVGMSMTDVDRLTGSGGRVGIGSSGNMASMMWTHSCGLNVHTYSGKVVDCRCADMTISGPGSKETIADTETATMLRSGHSPKEVEEKIGRASCGFCNEAGTVTLLYTQPAIEVVFVDERLLRWRRVVTYKDEPLPQE